MAGRKAYSTLPSVSKKSKSNSKPRQKSIKRNNALDAFAIASEQYADADQPALRRNRMGASEGGQHRPGKRGRRDDSDGSDDDSDDEGGSKRRRRDHRYADAEDGGSDSEGNEWVMGQVPSDDDSDLDSDEAFGESDEERFADMAFSGSSKSKPKKKTKKRSQDSDVDLDEDESEDEDDDDLSSLGEDAVDLADMLDASESEEDTKTKKGNKDDGSSDEDSDDESDDESSASSFEEFDDEEDPEKLAALQSLIAGLPESESKKSEQRRDGANEFDKPSDFGIKSQTKLTLEDLGLPGVSDPHVKKSLKLLSDEPASNRKGRPGKLAVPLPQRQQDALDRTVAYEETNKTLNRWVDTVQHNRQADHLVFPLPNPDIENTQQNHRLQPTTNDKPFNELEATIQSILEESGLGGKDAEDKIMEFEESAASKLSMEEVKARRAQLRMARELMFREEARAKRIKKIKSKSYRRVHRKEREKEAAAEQAALVEAGIEPSDDERERQDRQRAMERMGSRHRDSKWAKANKETGRTAWDEDARAGVVEMARRNEELRRRVEGRTPNSDGEYSDESSGSDDSDSDDDAVAQKLLDQLKDTSRDEKASGFGSALANMKFMRNAEANKRRLNDEAVAQLRRELVGEESGEDAPEPQEIGRRTFGAMKATTASVPKEIRQEFEEPEEMDEDADEVTINTGAASSSSVKKNTQAPKIINGGTKTILKSNAADDSEGGAWSKTYDRKNIDDVTEVRVRKQKMKNSGDVEIDLSQAAIAGKKSKPAKSKTSAITTATALQTEDSDSDSDADATTLRLPYAIKDQDLIKRAFAGADVVGEFEEEKEAVIEEDEEKEIDATLPGWGSWTGDGLSKRAQKKNKGRFTFKKEGIKATDRKDAKLDRVIINEKRVKKNDKYLASALPHPFETKAQYERSLRIPVGPEWTTKETFQSSTKPRVLVKQGIIAPMAKPLL